MKNPLEVRGFASVLRAIENVWGLSGTKITMMPGLFSGVFFPRVRYCFRSNGACLIRETVSDKSEDVGDLLIVQVIKRRHGVRIIFAVYLHVLQTVENDIDQFGFISVHECPFYQGRCEAGYSAAVSLMAGEAVLFKDEFAAAD